MRYFNIILRQDSNRELIYPVNYQAEIGNYSQGHLYYDEGENNPCLLLCIRDKNVNNIIRKDVEEITEEEAKVISETKEIRKEIITDETKIRRIELKAKMGRVLTPDEEKAIDLNDPTPGFNMSKILADKIDEMKIKEKR